MAADDTKPKELTSTQRKAIAHLLASRNVEEAAKASGISERTLYRWMADEVFHAALVEAETHAIDYAVRRLVVLQDRAIDTLADVLENEKASITIKVRASLGLIDALIRLRELRNLEGRLVALEQMIYGNEALNNS
jgi:hypothetical protein